MNNKQLIFENNNLKPNFSNIVNINTNNSEFTFDFIYDNPNTPAVLLKRITLNPESAKGLAQLMSSILDKYEEEHGKIKPTEINKTKIGFDTENNNKI